MSYEQIQIARDCEAVQIPQGTMMTIPAGTSAVLTQSLGGSYTLQIPSLGGLFRVAGKDADALGMEAAEPAAFEPEAPAEEPLEPKEIEEPEVPSAPEPVAESLEAFPVEEEEPEFATLVEEGPFVIPEPDVEPSPAAEMPAI